MAWYDWENIGPFVNAGVGIGGNLLANKQIQSGINKATDTLAPYTQTGQNAMAEYYRQLQEGPMPSFESYTKTPAYTFPLQEGLKAVERSAAARGGLVSGATGKQLTRYGSDYASTKYTDWINQWQNSLKMYNPLMQIGYNAANQVGNYNVMGGMAGGATTKGITDTATNLIGYLVRQGATKEIIDKVIGALGLGGPSSGVGIGAGAGGGNIIGAGLGGVPGTSIGTGTIPGSAAGTNMLAPGAGLSSSGTGADLIGTNIGFGPINETMGTASMAQGGEYLLGGALPTAALGVGMVGAFAALMNAFGPQISDIIGGSTHLGINPFTDTTLSDGTVITGPVSTILASAGPAGTHAISDREVRAAMEKIIPDTKTLAGRFAQETGITPPQTPAEATEVADMFQSWLFQQPEIRQAVDYVNKWHNENYQYSSSGEGGPQWTPTQKRQFDLDTMSWR